MSFVASNVAFLRRRLGYSQAQFADKLAIKRSLLGAYEESRATPRYDVLEQISQLSGESVSDLLNKRLVPEGYEAPLKRGRRAPTPTPKSIPEPTIIAKPAFEPQLPAEANGYSATLTLTVDTKGAPLATLITQAELAKYGGLSHQASYIASLPVLTVPFLAASQPYRAFELEPGQIHICKLVRNWGGISAAGAGNYVLAYRKRVVFAKPEIGSKGLTWVLDGDAHTTLVEEPLEIWQSEWVLTNSWQPLPAQLAAIAERLALIEEKLG